MNKTILLATLSALMNAGAPAPNVDPLDALITDPIDLEVQDAPIGDVILLIGSIADTSVDLDPCVSGTVSMKIERVTLRTLLETFAESYALEYDRSASGALRVGCHPRPGASTRVDFRAVDAPLREVLEALSAVSGTPVLASGCEGVAVDIAVSNAPLRPVVFEVAAQAGAAVVEDGPAGMSMRCGH